MNGCDSGGHDEVGVKAGDDLSTEMSSKKKKKKRNQRRVCVYALGRLSSVDFDQEAAEEGGLSNFGTRIFLVLLHRCFFLRVDGLVIWKIPIWQCLHSIRENRSGAQWTLHCHTDKKPEMKESWKEEEHVSNKLFKMLCFPSSSLSLIFRFSQYDRAPARLCINAHSNLFFLRVVFFFFF